MTRRVSQTYEFGAFRLDTVRRLLLREGEIVPLTPKAFDTLLALVENSERVLDKDELLRLIWTDTIVEERNLTVNISTLRKALGEAATEHRYIVTVPGRGYRFAADVHKVTDPGQETGVDADSISDRIQGPPEADRRLPGTTAVAPVIAKRKGYVLSFLIVVVATAIALITYLFKTPRQSLGGTPTPIRSMAVLPFKPLASDSRDESLELGMADTLIMRLSNLRQIVVRPISAVRKYGGLDQDPLAAGREQGVDAVLDGSIQKTGERIRVTVRLMRAADGQQLWADKFEDKFTDIFAVQDSISERVASALSMKLTTEEENQLTKHYTKNAEAYHLYVRGRYFASKWTPEGFDKGVECFTKALALDPNYALAYDGMAYCYYGANWWAPWRESQEKARAFARKALLLDDSLAEAHTSLGIITTWADYDWLSAEREFQRAFELKPNYAAAHQWYGFLLIPLGRNDESIAEARRAVELDPLSSEANTAFGTYLFYARRYEEAVEQLRATLELDPNYWFARLYLARAYEKTGKLNSAIAELEKTRLIEGVPAEVTSALGYSYALAEKKSEAQRIIVELKEQSKRMYVAPYNFATIYSGLGEKERALEYLEKEVSEGAYYANLLRVDPELDSLRKDPRFEALLRTIRPRR